MSKYNEINFPIGSKVIIKSNEPNPYQIGTVIGFHSFHDDIKTIFPVVEVEGKDYVVFGIMKHYHPLRAKALDKLTPEEQWNVMSDFHIEDRSEK